MADRTVEQEQALALARARLRLKQKAELSSEPAVAPEPDLAHNLKVAGSSLVENLPSAIGTALGTLGGGAFGSLATPVVGTIAGGIAGGVAGGKGAEELADLATRYATGNPEATYRGYIQSKIGSQPTSEGERLARAMIETGMDVGAGLGVGSLAKGATKAAVRKAGELMVAQPLTQLAAGEAGTAGTELSDSQAVGFGASLIPSIVAAVVAKRQFPKQAAAKTLDEWRRVRDNAYETLKDAGVVLKDKATKQLGDKLLKIINREGYDSRFQTLITPVKESIEDKIAKGQIDFKEIKELGENINAQITEAYSKSPKDAERLRKVYSGVNDFIDNLLPSDFSKGGKKINFVRDTLKEAKEATRKVAKMKVVHDILQTAENAQDISKISKGFKKVSEDLYAMKQFSDEEKNAIKNLAKGKLDAIGTLAPGITGTGATKSGAYATATGVLAALGFPMAAGLTAAAAGFGTTAKTASNYLKPKAAKNLLDLISRGYTPPKFSWSKTMAPSVSAGVRGAMAPEEEPEQKAVGGLASLKKRYG